MFQKLNLLSLLLHAQGQHARQLLFLGFVTADQLFVVATVTQMHVTQQVPAHVVGVAVILSHANGTRARAVAMVLINMIN